MLKGEKCQNYSVNVFIIGVKGDNIGNWSKHYQDSRVKIRLVCNFYFGIRRIIVVLFEINLIETNVNLI